MNCRTKSLVSGLGGEYALAVLRNPNFYEKLYLPYCYDDFYLNINMFSSLFLKQIHELGNIFQLIKNSPEVDLSLHFCSLVPLTVNFKSRTFVYYAYLLYKLQIFHFINFISSQVYLFIYFKIHNLSGTKHQKLNYKCFHITMTFSPC